MTDVMREEFQAYLGDVIDEKTMEALSVLIPPSVNPSSVVPIIAGIVKRLPEGMSTEEIVAGVRNGLTEKAKANRKQGTDQPGSARMLVRKHLDSLMLEMRLMGSGKPSTEVELFGQKFASPIMTAALSHMSPFRKGEYGVTEYLAQGAMNAGCLHWVGMMDDDQYLQVAETGVRMVRVVKPYVDEDKIFSQLETTAKSSAVAVAMDIDHTITTYGENDLAMGEEIELKSIDRMKDFVQATDLPFILKGVLSVQDALAAKEIGADAIMVSNHGGRLPYVVPPLVVLPEIRKAVGDDMKIFVDCGMESGIDVYKAMALGADAVGVGKHLIPIVQKGGAEAVTKRLTEMTEELRGAMAFTGVCDCASFDPTVLHQRNF